MRSGHHMHLCCFGPCYDNRQQALTQQQSKHKEGAAWSACSQVFGIVTLYNELDDMGELVSKHEGQPPSS